MTRIERALLAVLGLAFAFLLVVILHGCGSDHYVPVGNRAPFNPPAECACHATLVQTEDGGMCEWPGALCPRVCTCASAPLCPDLVEGRRAYVCMGDEDGG